MKKGQLNGVQVSTQVGDLSFRFEFYRTTPIPHSLLAAQGPVSNEQPFTDAEQQKFEAQAFVPMVANATAPTVGGAATSDPIPTATPVFDGSRLRAVVQLAKEMAPVAIGLLSAFGVLNLTQNQSAAINAALNGQVYSPTA